MKKQIFAVCDSEEAYARKVFEFIHSKQMSAFEICLFTDIEELRIFLQNKVVEILLISQNLYYSSLPIQNVQHLILLNDRDIPINEEMDSIYKYQPTDILLKEVMSYCAKTETSDMLQRGSGRLKVIGIYTPLSRCFQTTFALTMGQMLAQKSKTLYLNFESYSGFGTLLDQRYIADIFDLVYFMNCAKDSFAYRLSSIVEHIGNLDYIPPTMSFWNYSGIDGAKWIELIKTIEERTDYEYLILELSENLMGLFDILRNCNSIYTITDNNRYAEAKMTQYKALLGENEYSDILDRTNCIRIPYVKEIPEDFAMLPYSDLAQYIKYLLAEEKRTE